VIAEAAPDDVYFWATHNGAELDLLLLTGGRRVGVEVKRVDAPRRTRSMAVARDDLRLDALYVVYPGDVRYVIDDRITALPAAAPFPASDAGAGTDRRTNTQRLGRPHAQGPAMQVPRDSSRPPRAR
ncbi:MAG: hypothetical protein OXQ28_10195, partial [Acidobacteriota bacterium]|nr:hypothetical protein [Acidobacteriota bacterium]